MAVIQNSHVARYEKTGQFGDVMSGIRMLKAGEQGLVVEFGSEIDPAINARVHHLARLLASQIPELILELVPTYRSLMVYFDPLVIRRKKLEERITGLLARTDKSIAVSESGRTITIPVAYGGEFGPDLDFVARHNLISPEEVIAIHTSAPYLVYMLGFTPGFPYLGGISGRIAAPRLETPRVKIPAGSVGIAGAQTGVYPIESPGGWQLIGRTPLFLFQPEKENPFLIAAGDYLQFTAISHDEFRSLKSKAESGSYTPPERHLTGDSHVHGH